MDRGLKKIETKCRKNTVKVDKAKNASKARMMSIDDQINLLGTIIADLYLSNYMNNKIKDENEKNKN